MQKVGGIWSHIIFVQKVGGIWSHVIFGRILFAGADAESWRDLEPCNFLLVSF